MVSRNAAQIIDDLVSEVFDAAFDHAKGVTAMVWQSLVEDEFGAGGQRMHAEIATEIKDKVAVEGEGILSNRHAIRHQITEVVILKVKNKVAEDFNIPLRAWVARKE